MNLSPAPGDTSRSLALHDEMTAADWWFARLDQRPCTVGNVRWTMQVLGVHVDRFHTWIQIEFTEAPGSSLLLHLTPWAGLQEAVNIVRAEIMSRTSSEPAGADSHEWLGDCQNVIIREVVAPAQPHSD